MKLLSLSRRSLIMAMLMRTRVLYTSTGISSIALRDTPMVSSSHKKLEIKMPKMKLKGHSPLKVQHKAKRTREILLFGKTLSQESPAGIHHGAKVDQDGTLSALQ